MSYPSAEGARLVGTVLSGRYLVQELLSESPHGALYRGEHAHMRKRIAIKVLFPEAARREGSLARFEREAVAGANVDHPNVVAAKDFGSLEDGTHFLVLEFLDGTTLREAMRQRISEARALGIARQIALALDAAHATGIVHRALAPEHIWLVERGGERDVVKLIDWSSARLPPSLVSKGPNPAGRAQRARIPLGPLPAATVYAPPEQLAGQEVDFRGDLYALGAILYELITGTRPDASDSPGRLASAFAPSPIAPGLESLVERLLARDPGRRPSSAIEVADALGALAASATIARGSDIPARPPVSSPAASAMTTAGPLPPDQASRVLPAKAALPRSIVFGLAGTGGIVVIVLVAIAIRQTPFKDLEEVPRGEATTAPTSGRASVSAGSDIAARRERDEDEPSPQPEASTRELRAQLSKEVRSGKHKEAASTIKALLKSDPRAAEDDGVSRDIEETAARLAFNAEQDPAQAPSTDQVFGLLASSKLGSAGPEILYRMVSGRGGSKAAERAQVLLADESVLKRATPATQIAYELWATKGCKDKAALLDRAKDHGDGRTLGRLQMMARECDMKKDPKLKEAMEAIKARMP